MEMNNPLLSKLEKIAQKKLAVKEHLKELNKQQKAEQRRLSQKERKARTTRLIVLGDAFERTGLDKLINYDFTTAVGILSKFANITTSEIENYKKLGMEFIENTKK